MIDMAEMAEYINLKVDAQVREMISFHNPISLGELRVTLYNLPLADCVHLDYLPILYAGEIISYRGYYNYPAIVPTTDPSTVEDLIKQVDLALSGKVYHGYKGGEYTYSRLSPVWVSDWGSSSGRLLIDIWAKADGVLLVTEVIE